MTTHNHALVQAGEVAECFFLVLGLERLGEVEGFHLDQDIDAPAVGSPVGEVCVVVSRARPYDCTVLHLARPCFVAILICLADQLADLLTGLNNTGINTAVHLVVPLTEQLVARSEQLRILGLVDLPLLQLVRSLLIKALHSGEVSVPVPFCTGLILDELYAGLDILGGRLQDGLVLVAHGEAEVEHGCVREAACKVRGCHGGTVAGHGAGDKAAAHVGQCVDNQSAALGRRNRAGIGGQTEGLDCIDVRYAGELVDLGDEEDGQQLVRNTAQIGEACHDLTHGHLVKGHEHLVKLLAVTVLAVSLGQKNEVLCNVAEYIVDKQVAHAESAAALTHDVLIHKAVAAEVGDHPAVVQSTVECGNEILGEGHKEHAPHTSPLIEVVCSVLNAAPLTTYGCHCALGIQSAKSLFAVKDSIELALLVECHECIVLFLDALCIHLQGVLPAVFESFPVGLFEHLVENAATNLQVFPLLLPVDVIFCLKKLRIGIFRSLSHYLLPSSL